MRISGSSSVEKSDRLMALRACIADSKTRTDAAIEQTRVESIIKAGTGPSVAMATERASSAGLEREFLACPDMGVSPVSLPEIWANTHISVAMPG